MIYTAGKVLLILYGVLGIAVGWEIRILEGKFLAKNNNLDDR
jgi:hypothetical protein